MSTLRHLQVLAALLHAVLLSAGCAALPQATPHPATAVQPQLCEPEGEALQAWWTELADPQLNALVSQGLAANEDLAQAVARLEQAQAAIDGAQAARRPRLDAAAVAGRERVPLSRQRDPQGERVTIPAFRQSQLSALLEGRYEVDLFGRLREAAQAARLEHAASACDLAMVRRWMAREVVLAYADWQLAEDEIRSHARARAVAGQLAAAEVSRLQAGAGTRVQWRESERAILDLQDAQAAWRHERDRAHARLSVLAGRPPSELRIEPADGYFERAAPATGALPAALQVTDVGARPDVAAAWHRVAAAAAEARQVRLERYPALTLSGSAGYVSNMLRRWLKGEALAWMAQAAVQSPLLDGGRADARERLAAASLAESQASYRKTVLLALADLGTALAEVDAADARLRIAQQQHLQAEADRAAAQAAWRAGQASRPATLRSERALIDSVRMTQQRRHALLVAWIQAQQALGR